MTDFIKKTCDVAIIGAGPTGLSAAITLREAGIERVLVLDREPVAGGIPRHCGHPPFGIKEFKRVLTGPRYARRIVSAAEHAGVEISLKSSVTQVMKQGRLSFVSPSGVTEVNARAVLLATGTRETPRSARFVSGNRPIGICNTGALQSMVYLKNMVPFRNPLVVGSEIVSFSALLTCKKAGIRPVAMIEEKRKPEVRWPIHYAASFFGVPLRLNTKIKKIYGDERVQGVQILDKTGKVEELSCDGVLFTGQFTPESTLARMSHLELDPITGSPAVNQSGRCSDAAYYAAGNLVFSPVHVAGRCWQAGSEVARKIISDLAE